MDKITYTIKRKLGILGLIILVACATENEKSGLEKIETNYGAKVSYTKSINKDSGLAAESLFNIIVNNSPMLDTLNTGQTSTNIASIFYGALTPEEQKDCEVVTVEIINSKTDKAEKFKYTADILNACWTQSRIYRDFSENLLDKDYDGIADNMLKEFYTDTMADGIRLFMENITDNHGKLISYTATGIGIITAEDESKHYQYSGYLEFKDGYRRPYIVNASVDTAQEEISGFLLEEGITL